ncbi:MAG TPA: BON domain-containing protein [Bacteriovoracaceae bacterium]|nr:BON domain-containing protein [Bacteriovoracaceae bacterium]
MGRQNFGTESSLKAGNALRDLNNEYGGPELDSKIYQEVIEGFTRSHIDTDHLVVNVEHSRVFLRGLLESSEQKKKIEEFVRQVDGVLDVRNEIHIRD